MKMREMKRAHMAPVSAACVSHIMKPAAETLLKIHHLQYDTDSQVENNPRHSRFHSLETAVSLTAPKL